jgi:hypothetical protein
MPLFKRKKSKSNEKKKVVASKKKKSTSPSLVPVESDASRGSALKVEENQFYILVKKPMDRDEDEEEGDPKEITLYSTVKAPIIRIKEYLRNEVDVESIELMTVKILDEALEAESVPWNKIAVELIG